MLIYINFAGMRKDEISKVIYQRAVQKINFAMNIFTKGLFLLVIMHLSPFILVLLHFFMGKYSIDSWFFYYPVW